MTFVNMYSPGLKILATHRVLRNVEGFTAGNLLAKATGEWSAKSFVSPAELKRELSAEAPPSVRIGVVTAADVLLLTRPRKDGELDVPVLHTEVIGGWLGIGEDAVRAHSICARHGCSSGRSAGKRRAGGISARSHSHRRHGAGGLLGGSDAAKVDGLLPEASDRHGDLPLVTRKQIILRCVRGVRSGSDHNGLHVGFFGVVPFLLKIINLTSAQPCVQAGVEIHRRRVGRYGFQVLERRIEIVVPEQRLPRV